MLTVHPTLLIGPSDWQPERMPESEFCHRIEALWQSCPAATRALVYGSPRHHGELAYLTNFVPKLEPALALLSRNDRPRLLVGGGANMLGAARPLTWIKDIAPLKDLKSVCAPGCLLIGGGYMTTATRRALGEMPDVTPRMWTQMRRKSSFELAAIREASAALGAAITSIRKAQRAGAGVTAAILAGERTANEGGAQDVRTLFSVDGGCTLQPFGGLIERAVDLLQVYVAVRQFNYWAEGFAALSERVFPLAEAAGALLNRAVAVIRPGCETATVADILAAGRAPYVVHPVTQDAFATSMGTALEEPPYTDLATTFAAGEVYSLRAGLSDGQGQGAILSAMIAVREGGAEVLWSAMN